MITLRYSETICSSQHQAAKNYIQKAPALHSGEFRARTGAQKGLQVSNSQSFKDFNPKMFCVCVASLQGQLQYFLTKQHQVQE